MYPVCVCMHLVSTQTPCICPFVMVCGKISLYYQFPYLRIQRLLQDTVIQVPAFYYPHDYEQAADICIAIYVGNTPRHLPSGIIS